jgi:hypothetical protein
MNWARQQKYREQSSRPERQQEEDVGDGVSVSMGQQDEGVGDSVSMAIAVV